MSEAGYPPYWLLAQDRALLDAIADWFVFAIPDADGMMMSLRRDDPIVNRLRRAVADYRDSRGAP